jgi:hypothetical protein
MVLCCPRNKLAFQAHRFFGHQPEAAYLSQLRNAAASRPRGGLAPAPAGPHFARTTPASSIAPMAPPAPPWHLPVTHSGVLEQADSAARCRALPICPTPRPPHQLCLVVRGAMCALCQHTLSLAPPPFFRLLILCMLWPVLVSCNKLPIPSLRIDAAVGELAGRVMRVSDDAASATIWHPHVPGTGDLDAQAEALPACMVTCAWAQASGQRAWQACPGRRDGVGCAVQPGARSIRYARRHSRPSYHDTEASRFRSTRAPLVTGECWTRAPRGTTIGRAAHQRATREVLRK